MNTKPIFVAAALFVTLLALVPSGNAECCKTVHKFGRAIRQRFRCGDCTRPKHIFCGVGDCNMFGCNCDYGCRRPVEGRTCSYECCDSRSDREIRDVGDFTAMSFTGNFTGNDVINENDTNKDGRLDEMEVKIFATRYGLPDDAWRHLDMDGDNHLSAHEIDSDLVSIATVMV